jgi:tetratricopeptide (TPR) repeat protein
VRTTRITAIALLAALAACQNAPRDDQRTGSVRAEDLDRARARLSPEVRTELDSANEAYRRGEYEAARERYQVVVRLDESVAAGWFGIYMAETALGNADAAETAIRRAREAAPRASLIEAGADTAAGTEPGP